jgi:hypothetical protein
MLCMCTYVECYVLWRITYVRLLGPCFKTGWWEAFCQSPSFAWQRVTGQNGTYIRAQAIFEIRVTYYCIDIRTQSNVIRATENRATRATSFLAVLFCNYSNQWGLSRYCVSLFQAFTWMLRKQWHWLQSIESIEWLQPNFERQVLTASNT